MPKNTGAGVIIACFSLIFGFAMIWEIWWMALVGFIGILVVWIGKSFDHDVDYFVPVDEIARIENQHHEQIRNAGVKHVN